MTTPSSADAEARRDRQLAGLLLLLAIALRFASFWASAAGPYSYDLVSHLSYIEWFRQHTTLPSCEVARVATHPPLFHFLGGLLRRTGVELLAVRWIPFVAASLRCTLIFAALQHYVTARAARLFAMALVAVLPVAVHLDGMVSNESLSCLFSAATIVGVLAGIERPRAMTWLAVGVVAGLAWLSKASVLTLGAAAVLALLLARDRRALRVAPLALIGFVAIAGWHVAHNLATYGKLVPLTFDCRELGDAAPYLQQPYWQRRPLGWFVGFTPTIFALPYFPTGLEPPRFWSVLLASTFADYYNHGFGHRNTVDELGLVANGFGINLTTVWLSRVSVAGGAVLACGTIASLVAVLRRGWQARRADWLFVALAPIVATAGLLHFATTYPIDYLGMVKGAYLVYVAPLLCVLAGLGFQWSLDRSRALAAIWVVALLAIAAYTLYCRVPLYVYPA